MTTYTFTTIEPPGAISTDLRGINQIGQVVGSAVMSDDLQTSFVYRDGAFTWLPLLTGGVIPYPQAINDAGVVVGVVFPPDSTGSEAFIWTRDGYRTFSKPGWASTDARGINDVGSITGFSYDVDSSGLISDSIAFIYDPKTEEFSDIDRVEDARLQIAQGQNAQGQVVGGGQLRPGGAEAFLRDPRTGALTVFQLAGRPTRARGINGPGVMVGFYDAEPELYRGFVGTAGGYQTLSVAGASATFPQSINDAGQISGFSFEEDGTSHGFIATPAGMSVPVEAATTPRAPGPGFASQRNPCFPAASCVSP